MKVSLRLVISIFAVIALVATVAIVLGISVSFSQAAAEDLADQYADVGARLAVQRVMKPFQYAAESVYGMQRRTEYMPPQKLYAEVASTTTAAAWRAQWSSAFFGQMLGSNYTVGVLNGFEDGTHVECGPDADVTFYDEIVVQNADGTATATDTYRYKTNLSVASISSSSIKYDPRQRPWYRATSRANLTWTPTFLSLSPYTVIAIAAAGSLYNDGRKIGVNTLALILSGMSADLRASAPHDSLKLVILNADNYLLATSYDAPMTLETPIPANFSGVFDEDHCVLSDPGAVRQIISCQLLITQYSGTPSGLGDYVASVPLGQDTRQMKRFAGHNYIVGLTNLNTYLSDTGAIVPNMNWRLISVVDLDQVQGKVTYGRNVSIIVACVILVVLTLAIIIATNVLLAPLSQMVRQVHQSSMGEPVEVEPFDSMFTELSMLATAQENAAKNVRNVADAPKEGSVTLLFTDIESSTLLWGTCSNSMANALETHHQVVREAIQEHHGYEVKTVGDSFMIAVKSAVDGVRIAVSIQEKLQKAPFPRAIEQVYAAKGIEKALGAIADNAADLVQPDSSKTWHGIRVRIGIHTGNPDVVFDEVAKGYDYYGPPVNIAARVESIGHGGQIVVSKAVNEAIANDASLSHLKLTVLGMPYLKGVTEPVEVYQLTPPSTQARTFPPLEVNKQTADAAVDSGDDRSSQSSRQSSRRLPFGGLQGHELTMARSWDIMTKLLPPGLKREMLAKLCKSWRLEQQSVTALAKRTGALLALPGHEDAGGIATPRSASEAPAPPGTVYRTV